MMDNGDEQKLAYSTLADLDGILPETSWIWRGRLAAGYLTLLAGDPGAGKSAICLDIAARILADDTWPDDES